MTAFKPPRHLFKIALEIVVGLVLVMVVCGGVLAVMLSQGPIDLNRLIPFIERQINQDMPSDQVSIGSLQLEWQGQDNPLGLQATAITMSNERGPFLFAPEIDMDISLRSLLIGKLRIQDLWIRRLNLSITRTVDGQIQVTGNRDENLTDAPYDAIPAIVTLNDFIYDLPSFDAVWLDDAKIVYRDAVTERTDKFDPVKAYIAMTKVKGDRTLSGFLTLPFGRGDVKETVTLNFKTQNDPLNLKVTASLKDMALDHFFQFLPPLPEGMDINMIVNAGMQATLDNLWTLQALNLDVVAPRGQINFINNGTPEMVDISDLSLSMRTNPNTHQMDIEKTSFTVNETVKFGVSGVLREFNMLDKMAGNIVLTAENLPQAWFGKYWPKTETDNGAYEWLVQNMADGTFETVQMKAMFDRMKTSRADSYDFPPWLGSIVADFKYKDMTINYRKPLPRATNVNGTGEYKNISLSLAVETANIGGLRVKDATLEFDDLITPGAGHGTLKFPITGDVQSVFDYISTDPINAFEAVDFNPKDAKGRADLVADIIFPLAAGTPIDAFDINVTGILNDVSLDNAVRDLTLTGGPYDLKATLYDIGLKGSGALAGQPITLDWHEYFSAKNKADYLSKISATLALDDNIRQTFMKDFARYFGGITDAKIDYVTAKNGKDTSISLDLDLEKSRVEAKSLGILKPEGTASTATLEVGLKNGDLVAIRDLMVNGKALSLDKGNITFITKGGEPIIQKGTLRNLKSGENTLSVTLDGKADGLGVSVEGAFLDARPILAGDKDTQKQDAGQASRPLDIKVNVAKMRTADDQEISNVDISTRNTQTGKIEHFIMTAKAGRGDLMVRYTPDTEGRLSLQVESSDAGDTLRAFDLYPNIQGGTLRIAGVPLEGGRFGDVRGQARIDNFKATDGPVLIRLLNALSFKGGGKDLEFSRLEAGFEWRVGPNGDLYTITDGRTAGASIGLTFDGYVDTANNKMNIKGTAAPLTGINNIVSNIPIIGDILTGGGALVAATYSIDGTTKDPQVSVNPLSFLTPGILRKMLFESTPTSSEDRLTPTDKKPRGLN